MGTGHSQLIGMEMFVKASNLANVNAIMYDMVLLNRRICEGKSEE